MTLTVFLTSKCVKRQTNASTQFCHSHYTKCCIPKILHLNYFNFKDKRSLKGVKIFVKNIIMIE